MVRSSSTSAIVLFSFIGFRPRGQLEINEPGLCPEHVRNVACVAEYQRLALNTS
jgi:hypothetical protein